MPNLIQFTPVAKRKSAKLLDAVTTAQTSDAAALGAQKSTYQATVAGTGAVAATVVFEFSDDGVGWLAGETVTLSGTTTASGGGFNDAPWAYIRANLTAISGTGAALTATVTE
jgi:hypothetical protein